MPESWGLGVHLTLDLHGSAKFGPDVEWLDTVEYNVDEQLADKFYSVIRLYWPGLPDGALTPSYSGIRSKVCTSWLEASMRCWLLAPRLSPVPASLHLVSSMPFLWPCGTTLWRPGRQLSCWRDRHRWPLQTWAGPGRVRGRLSSSAAMTLGSLPSKLSM